MSGIAGNTILSGLHDDNDTGFKIKVRHQAAQAKIHVHAAADTAEFAGCVFLPGHIFFVEETHNQEKNQISTNLCSRPEISVK